MVYLIQAIFNRFSMMRKTAKYLTWYTKCLFLIKCQCWTDSTMYKIHIDLWFFHTGISKLSDIPTTLGQYKFCCLFSGTFSPLTMKAPSQLRSLPCIRCSAYFVKVLHGDKFLLDICTCKWSSYVTANEWTSLVNISSESQIQIMSLCL